MIKFVFSPEWFYGIDSLFEILGIIATLLIAFSAYRLYKFSGQKNYKFFSVAFFLFALGFVFKILTNITIYYEMLERTSFGFITIVKRTITSNEIFYTSGYLAFRLLMLLGLLGIYMVSFKKTSKKDIVLFVYLLFIVSVFSHWFYVIFHATAIFLLTYIFMFYQKNYKKRKSKQSLLVALAFLFMLASQIFFIVVQLNLSFYVLAEFLQLFGFLLLLGAYLMVLKK